ncbi:uncharacterized protein LOC122432096 isoform X2 [Cervus canadensis]|uniref:uncharacterized protein LOC122432096 isoform X2 n=1 Tax=Cervus canadensis TaxID=1574408 RepID=UPI001CA37BD9|nr:uncharacterized protein LOC122432096 isoform X2 [Cervus canadensis]
MALAAVTPRQPGQRTLPDRTGQRRQRTPAASSSRGGCTQGPRPRLRGPWALIFVVLGVLLLDSIWKKSVEVVPLAPMGQTTPIIQTPSLLAYLARLANQKKKKTAAPPARTLSVSANPALSVEKMHLNSVKNAAPGETQEPRGLPTHRRLQFPCTPFSLCFPEAPPTSQSSSVPVGSPEPAAALPTTTVCPARLSQRPLPTSPRAWPGKTEVLTADRSHNEATCVLLQRSYKTGAKSTGLTPSPCSPVAPESFLFGDSGR